MSCIEKKPKPSGVCDVCGQITDQHIDVNRRCTKTVQGKRCSGIFKSSLTMFWQECHLCNAIGKVGTQPCSECSGLGWYLIR